MALNNEGIASMLETLFDKTVIVTEIKPRKINASGQHCLGTYTDSLDKSLASPPITAVALFDFPFACYSAAALSMMPAGGAEDAVRTGDIPESLSDNMHEILNVCVGFFGDGSLGANLRLHEMMLFPPTNPTRLKETLQNTAGRKDYHIDIDGYGEGEMTLCLLG